MAYATTSQLRSTAPVPAPINTNIAMDNDMSRSASSTSEPSKPAKRKGTRSVSSLTPSQLARKRANDREAQRAIRARTKEHIERLERELSDLKSKSQSDLVNDLLRKNKHLEAENKRLRSEMGLPTYPNIYDAPLPSMQNSGLPGRSGSYGPPIRASQDAYGYPGPLTPDPHDGTPWPNAIPPHSMPPVTMNSSVSSPASSAPVGEDYPNYLTSSVPGLMDAVSAPPTSVPSYHHDVDYEDSGVDSDQGFHRPTSNHVSMSQSYPIHHHQQQQQQHWPNMYAGVSGVSNVSGVSGVSYYPNSPNM